MGAFCALSVAAAIHGRRLALADERPALPRSAPRAADWAQGHDPLRALRLDRDGTKIRCHEGKWSRLATRRDSDRSARSAYPAGADRRAMRDRDPRAMFNRLRSRCRRSRAPIRSRHLQARHRIVGFERLDRLRRCVLRGVRVGDNSDRDNAVVTKDVPANAVVGGVAREGDPHARGAKRAALVRSGRALIRRWPSLPATVRKPRPSVRPISAQSKRRMCSSLADEPLAELLVAQHPHRHLGQRLGVASAESQPRLLVRDHLPQPACVGDEARQPDAIASSAHQPERLVIDGTTQIRRSGTASEGRRRRSNPRKVRAPSTRGLRLATQLRASWCRSGDQEAGPGRARSRPAIASSASWNPSRRQPPTSSTSFYRDRRTRAAGGRSSAGSCRCRSRGSMPLGITETRSPRRRRCRLSCSRINRSRRSRGRIDW